MRSKVAHFAALAAILLALSPGLCAMPRHKHHHHHRRPVMHDVTVTPSEAIEERVEDEIVRAEDILDHLEPGNLFASPYLVSAIVYHDGFLSHFPKDKATADPSRRIVAHLTALVSPDVKQEYIDLLRHQYGNPTAVSTDLVRPVAGFIDERHLRRNHHDAIDVFASEGSPVHSAGPGVVILADAGWAPGDPFAVTSLRGGNSVVVFDPAANRFYRYCHLQTVQVQPGNVVQPGWVIGTVGHTGANAELTGHGRHLHFEVNEYDGRDVRSLDYRQLLTLLKAATPVPGEETDALTAAIATVLPIL